MPEEERGPQLLIHRMGLIISPSPEEAQQTVEQFLPGLERRILRPSRSQRASLLKGLAQTRRNFEGLEAEPLSRLATARYLIDLFNHSFVQRASRQERQGNTIGFAFHADSWVATFSTLDAVIRTELITMSGGVEGVLNRDAAAFEQIEGEAPDLSYQVNRSFAESGMYQRALSLLRLDRTGKALITESARSVRGEDNLYNNTQAAGLTILVDRFTQIGATLAEEAYKFVHPLNSHLS